MDGGPHHTQRFNATGSARGTHENPCRTQIEPVKEQNGNALGTTIMSVRGTWFLHFAFAVSSSELVARLASEPLTVIATRFPASGSCTA